MLETVCLLCVIQRFGIQTDNIISIHTDAIHPYENQQASWKSLQ